MWAKRQLQYARPVSALGMLDARHRVTVPIRQVQGRPNPTPFPLFRRLLDTSAGRPARRKSYEFVGL